MTSTKFIFLACTALAAAASAVPPASAAPQPSFSVAQAVAQAPKPLTPEEKKKLEEQKKKAPPAARPHAPQPPAAQRKSAAPPRPPVVQRKPAAPPQPPAVQRSQPAPRPPAAQVKPAAPAPATVQRKPIAPPPAAVQHKPAPVVRDNKDRRDHRNAQDRRPVAKPAPVVTPPAASPKPAAPAPTVVQKPAAPAPTVAAPKPAAPAPAITRAPQPAVPAAAAPPPPTKAQSAGQFIQRKGQKPSAGLDAVRKERRTTSDGNRTIIREGSRTIVRDGNRATIHHNEADRFAVGARKVEVKRKNNEIISIILRAAGISIISTTDRDGRLIRRVRRDRNGRETVIIDNSFAGARRGDAFVDVPPPRFRQPRDRYIVDAGRADRDRIYRLFREPPIERLERRYTLDQVLYNHPLREYMPRVDLDINFASGSWQISPGQLDELSIIADGLNRAIDRNPREVFLIEGHTDAVGSNEDNLSLSDRRAEAVAVALTEEFGVPPENLVTQGYGEEYLKVPTLGPLRENRRVAIRRITPLIDRTADR